MKVLLWLLLLSAFPALAVPTAYVATTCGPSPGCTVPSAVGLMELVPGRQVASVSVPRGASGIAYSPDGSRLYVADGGSSAIEVLSAPSGQSLGSYPLTLVPRGVFVSPDGTTLWATADNTATVAALSAADGTLLATIAVSDYIWSATLSRDGRRLYLALQNGHLGVIDTASRRLIADVPTPSPLAEGVAPSTDGTTIWLSGYVSQTQTGIIVLSGADFSVLRIIPTGGTVGAIGVQGSNAYLLSTLAGGSVTVIDIASMAITGTVSLGAVPQAMAFDGHGGLYVSAASAVYAVNTASEQVTGHFATQSTMLALAVSPDGTHGAGSLIADAVSMLDVATGAVTGSVPVVGGVAAVALTADGSKGFAVGGDDATMTIFDVASKQYRGSVRLPYPGGALAVAPDGSRVYVATIGSFLASGTLTVVDVATAAVVKNVSLPGFATGATGVPAAVAVTPDGSKVYVSAYVIPFEAPPLVTAYTLVFSTVTGRITGLIPGVGGYGLGATPDGRFIYAGGNSRLSVIDTQTDKVVATVPVGSLGPIVVSPDGAWVYAVDEVNQRLLVLRASTNRRVASIAVPNGPTGIAVLPDGSQVWVTRSASSLAVIDARVRAIVSEPALAGYSTGISFAR